MEWRRLKTIIILILLLVNAFLLVLVGARRGEARRYAQAALDNTIRVLEQNGVQADRGRLSDAGGLTPLSLERDTAREGQLVRALLDEAVEADNRGGGLYLYRGRLGEVSLRAGGELSATLAQDEHWRTQRPEAHAAALLRTMGVDARQTGLSARGEETAVRFRQLWNGVPVFSCEVEFTYADGCLQTIRGSLLIAGQGVAEAGETLALPTALLRFLDGVTQAGDVCSAIQSMEVGYRATVQPLSGGVRLTAAWLVSSDTADYYLDGATGTLTRLTGQ